MKKIAIIGLGYVGLPLARLIATKYSVKGFDIDFERIKEISEGHDSTLELDDDDLKKVLKSKSEINHSTGLFCTNFLEDISDCNYFIVTVPTPVNNLKRPNLSPLFKASELVGKVLKKGDIVIYESTVYPGVTEEECVPILEKISGLKFNIDFFVGYSPERINPGDKKRTVESIIKITSGSTPEVAEKVNQLYSSVITAGTYLAPSIKVAEASKVIENSQRDINIAFVNELAKIFNLIGIDTHEVLKAASTKWNFLDFKPGLVGGHCIGVDPYYIAQKAKDFGYHPEIILAGRRLNDSMGEYIANQAVKLMIKNNINVNGSEILILGITFKENCPDIRNTKIVDVIYALEEYGAKVTVFDPWANPKEVQEVYHLKSLSTLPSKKFDAIILGVAHEKFKNTNFEELKKENSILYDVKGFLPKSDYRL